MTSWQITPLKSPLEGEITVPGDKSVSHRALIFSSIAQGTQTLFGLSQSDDVGHTKSAMTNMGVTMRSLSSGGLEVQGVGLRGLKAPKRHVECGNSGTTMRLLTGLLAAQDFSTTLLGDQSLSKRPMKRLVTPLNAMGARIKGRHEGGNVFSPLNIEPPLNRIIPGHFELKIASAQVKSAVLLAGLYADGVTTVVEPMPSRDHTETLLQHMGAPLVVNGSQIVLGMDSTFTGLKARDVHIPGDPSSAAFAIVAAILGRSDGVVCKHIGIWKRRRGFLDVIKNMGISLDLKGRSDGSLSESGDLSVVKKSMGRLNGTVVEGELALRSLDEIPILALLASKADGETHFKDLKELRFKESDRISSTVQLLNSLGVNTREHDDGFVVFGEPDRAFQDTEIDARGDHRLAMSAVVAGFFAQNQMVVHGVDTINSSYKSFKVDMELLGARIYDI